MLPFGVTIPATVPQRSEIPEGLMNNPVYTYIVKHIYIFGSMFTNTKAQLHVSAINFGHLHVVHEEFINKLYQSVWGVYSL